MKEWQSSPSEIVTEKSVVEKLDTSAQAYTVQLETLAPLLPELEEKYDDITEKGLELIAAHEIDPVFLIILLGRFFLWPLPNMLLWLKAGIILA